MKVSVLGTVVVYDEAESIAVGGPRPTHLLALLVIRGSSGASIEQLTEELWSVGDRPADPSATIRTYVARLRSALGSGALETRSGRYVISPDVDVDAIAFERAVAAARAATVSPALAEMWRSALALWRGDRAYDAIPESPSILAEAARLDELRAEAVESWVELRLENGESRELAADIESAVAAFPYREKLRSHHMTALARAGRQVDALRSFQEFRSDLTELGLEPSSDLAVLDRKIAAGDLDQNGAVVDLRDRTPEQENDDPSAGRVRGYELGAQLGEGAFAVVHAGVQVSLGREVAIKQIRSNLADQPEFIRQFEAEAHLIARLEHPHIVPLYDYWREPGSAYLVMRRLDGGTIADRLLRAPLGPEETARYVAHVAAGLDEAHRCEIVHRDVKPANVLLDGQGNAYLSDFGIAVDEAERVDPEAWLSNGSPAYAPPEQLERRPVGPTADVYSLGVTAYEALTARLPFPEETTMAGLLQRQLNDPIPLARSVRPDVPAAVDTVLQRATAKKPGDRYSSAGAFAADLAAAVGLEGDEQLIEPQDRNPYKGLRAFDEADAADFAGRNRLVTKLLTAVERHRVTAVVGPSGSGKSSVVRAGLLPAVREGRIASADRWFVTTMIPGVDPFADLEAALLRVAVDPPADLTIRLREPRGLARVLARILDNDRQLLLVIDQFEELFTLAAAGMAERFLTAIVEATTEAANLRVVLTVRADFYDHPLRHDRFARLIEDSTIAVHPLAADELERAVTEPATSVGAAFEPGLIARITADVADQPGALPLLQYALTELYDRRVEHTMTLAAYEDLGGVSGAVGRRAEEVFGDLDSASAAATRQVFGRLVNLGEGTEDTRRRILRSELVDDLAVDRALVAFGSARLLSFDRETATSAPTVEVAHEALIREWPRLRGWLEEDRDGLRILRHLTETSTAWDERGREETDLYQGGRLEGAAEWAAGHGDELTPTEARFLEASTARATAEAEAERRANRRLRRLLVGVGVVAIVALIAGGLAFQQQSRADEQAAEALRQAEIAQENEAAATASETRAQDNADVAEQRTVEAESARTEAETARSNADTSRLGWQAAFQADGDRQLGLLMAAETAQRNPGVEGLSALQRVLVEQDQFLGLLGAGTAFQKVEWLDDETAVAFGETGIEVFNVDTGKSLRRLDTPVAKREVRTGDGEKIAVPLAAAAVGSRQAAYISDGYRNVRLVDLIDGVEVARFGVGGEADGIAISENGERIAVPRTDGMLELIDVPSGGTLLTEAHPGVTFADQELWGGVKSVYGEAVDATIPLSLGPTHVQFLDQSSEVITVRGFETRFWDPVTAEPSRPPRNVWSDYGRLAPTTAQPGERFAMFSFKAHVSAGSDLVVSSASLFTVSDLESGETATSAVFSGAGSAFFAPKLVDLVVMDEARAWALTSRGALSLVDRTTGEPIGEPFDSQTSGASDMALSPDRRRMLIAGESGVAMASVQGGRLLAQGIPRSAFNAASIDAEGRYLMRFDRSFSMTPDALDLATNATTTFPGEVSAWVEKDGGLLLTMNQEAMDQSLFRITPRIDPQTPVSEGFLIDANWEGSAMSPDQRLWAYGFSNEAVIMSLESSSELARTTIFDSVSPTSLSFSSDSARLAVAAAEEGFRLLKAPDWRPVDTPLDDLPIVFVKFSPDGKWLLDATSDGLIELRDADTLELIRTMIAPQGTIAAGGALFRADGAIVEVNIGGLPQLWDVATGEPIGQPFPADPGLAGFHGGEGSDVTITGIGDNFLLWNVKTDEWLDIACTAAGRNMTAEEWEQFGPTDEPYRATCPQWPALG